MLSLLSWRKFQENQKLISERQFIKEGGGSEVDGFIER